MSTQSVFRAPASPQRPGLQLLKPEANPASTTAIAVRLAFWAVGILLAGAQAWVYRFATTVDSISYLDMSDGVLPGGDWHRLINGVWSPLYPLLIGLARRIFPVSAANEISAAHLLNVGIFIFAFACFEFFLRSATSRVRVVQAASAQPGVPALLPYWAYLSIAYSLFLWASFSAISLRYLRPDMLMSGFLYLAVGILLQMQGSAARWDRYLALGVVLGIGFLAKAPMLPIGAVILAATLMQVEAWHPAVKMVAAAFAVMMLIGSLYFVPLSRARGHFTLGESSAFNYLVHVDQAGPAWYLQDPGFGRGSFTHPPEKIFSSPPTYAFALPHSGTQPLKFDPSDWIEGVRPRFVLRRQIATIGRSLLDNPELTTAFGVAGILMLGHFFRRLRHVLVFHSNWAMCVIGLAGCAMYSLVHVESRYVGAFLVLFWCGILFSLRVPQTVNRKVITAITLVVIGSLLLPSARLIYLSRMKGVGKINTAALIAGEFERVGIRAGDQVACICPVGKGVGLSAERIARVTVAAQVDHERAAEFWSLPIATQRDLLQMFAAHGVKAVIAVAPSLSAASQLEWTHLDSSQYWVWWPPSQ